jgi:sodium transport system ATP-binding protein
MERVMEELLTVSGLSKTFHLSKKQQKLEKTTEKVKVAVDDLSFCTYRGEVFGLLGPNGAGKTTTLRMLATLIKPDKGDALIDGSSIVTDPNGVRKKIGFRSFPAQKRTDTDIRAGWRLKISGIRGVHCFTRWRVDRSQ